MLTPREQGRVDLIKAAAENGNFVSKDEKQWILLIAARECWPLPADAIVAASRAGFITCDVTLDETENV